MDDDLRARITELEHAVAELRDRLARRGTMAQTLRCPCGGTTIFEFAHVLVVMPNSLESSELSLSARFVARNVVQRAPLAAFTCASCGLVEWHVTTFEGVVADGKHVIRHDGSPPPTPSDGPFR